MRFFDRVDSNTLDGRELQLWILAYIVIVVLAIGVGLLMYPSGLFPPGKLSEIRRAPSFSDFARSRR